MEINCTTVYSGHPSLFVYLEENRCSSEKTKIKKGIYLLMNLHHFFTVFLVTFLPKANFTAYLKLS